MSSPMDQAVQRNPLIDPIYIDNAAEAHLLAADRLEPGSAVAGKTYFFTQAWVMK